jgi:hypothetical protein
LDQPQTEEFTDHPVTVRSKLDEHSLSQRTKKKVPEKLHLDLKLVTSNRLIVISNQ